MQFGIGWRLCSASTDILYASSISLTTWDMVQGETSAAAGGSKRARSDYPADSTLLPPPPLKRIKTADNPFLPPAAAHHQISQSPRLNGLPPSGSSNSMLNGISQAYSQSHSQAYSQGQLPFSPALGSGHLGSLPSANASNPFTAQPANPFTGQPSNSFTAQPTDRFSVRHPHGVHSNNGTHSLGTAQDQLQAQFAAASQFAASQAVGTPHFPPPSPFGMPGAMQYGMPNPGFPPFGAHMGMPPAYADYAAYAAHAARLVSAGSYPNMGMHPPGHSMLMPNPYQFGQTGLPPEAPPPPPPY